MYEYQRNPAKLRGFNTHFPLLSNLCRISLSVFLTTKTQKGWSLTGANWGSSVSTHGAMSVVVSEGCDSLCAQMGAFGLGGNITHVSTRNKPMGLLDQCWLIALSNMFFSEGFKTDLFLLAEARSGLLKNSWEHPGFSYRSVQSCANLPRKASSLKRRNPPHHLSSPTKGWQSYQALEKTECEIRGAEVLHTSHIKTNLYIHTL